MPTTRPRVMTAIKPTNRLHIGNYVGAIKPIIELAKQNYEVFFMSADLHGLTDDNHVEDASEGVIRSMVGLCPSTLRFYVQSQHMEITYISWFLACCTPVGQLGRMTQFKSKETEAINSGYLFYPVLMAADILAINASLVPVGKDQKQHLELARDICDYFSHKFNTDLFLKPEAIVCESIQINSLQDPVKKMSKSDKNSYATIFLDDTDDEIRIKIQKAVSDSESMPENIFESKERRPAVFNLCQIFKEFSGKDFVDIEREFGGGYISKFKQSLTQLMIEKISEIREKTQAVDKSQIKHILDRDFIEIHQIINKNVQQLKQLCGLVF